MCKYISKVCFAITSEYICYSKANKATRNCDSGEEAHFV